MSKNKIKFKKKLTKDIIQFLEKKSDTVYNHKAIAEHFNLKEPDKRTLIHLILMEQAKKGNVVSTKHGHFKYNTSKAKQSIVGVMDFTQRGNAYAVLENGDEDVFIHSKNTGKAFHGDLVELKLFNKNNKVEGEVIRVLERNKTEIVCKIDVGKHTVFARPLDNKFHTDFFIEKGKGLKAEDGENVLVKFLSWPGGNKSPHGAVIEKFGKTGNIDTDMNLILADKGFQSEFDKKVEDLAAQIKEPDYDNLKGRRDFRDVLTFTIDPVDAKDFDDALSFQYLDNGLMEIGVHIADVSHYVTPNNELDKEAYIRGNSVYLVDRVIPMLPEVLSNQLCSLRPNETKVTFSAVFQMNDKAEIKNVWLGKTIIYSDHRYAYEEAQEIIEKQTSENDIEDAVLKLDKLAKIMRGRRLENGALDIESQEVRFTLDKEGNPAGVQIKVSKDANKLIEEFMLLANRKVAEFIGKPEKNKKIVPFVYRIHDEPDEQKIEDLKILLKLYGYKIKMHANKPIAYSLNEVMEKAKKKDELSIIGPMVIRSMSKAVYSPENIGHYGLGFDYYTHFTSPIRRYADLLVHRMLQDKLTGKTFKGAGDLEKQCKHISSTEKSATEAERESIKYAQMKYMEDKVGMTFEGVISGVTEFGIFIELKETLCEGLLHIRNLDGNYHFEEKYRRLEAKNSSKKYSMGDTVDVVVKNVDLQKKQMDLILPDEWE